MRTPPGLKRLIVITGHYGCGKTNLSVNLVLDLAETHDVVTLVDLDIVNPYFRSSDFAEMLAARGVRVISPTFAGTTLDAPSLSAAVGSAFEGEGPVVFDVGGDDAGATALGRYARQIQATEHDVLYVVNRYRNLTATPAEAAELLGEIEAASHLKATGVVNNSHLRDETTLATVIESVPYAQQTAQLLGLPLVFTTVPARLFEQLAGLPSGAAEVPNAYPVETYVRTPWEDVPGVSEEAL